MHEQLRARSWGPEAMLRSVVTVAPPSLFHWTWLIAPSTGSFPALGYGGSVVASCLSDELILGSFCSFFLGTAGFSALSPCLSLLPGLALGCGEHALPSFLALNSRSAMALKA